MTPNLSPTKVAWFRDELERMVATLARTQADRGDTEYVRGYLSALSHMSTFLGIDTSKLRMIAATVGREERL